MNRKVILTRSQKTIQGDEEFAKEIVESLISGKESAIDLCFVMKINGLGIFPRRCVNILKFCNSEFNKKENLEKAQKIYGKNVAIVADLPCILKELTENTDMRTGMNIMKKFNCITISLVQHVKENDVNKVALSAKPESKSAGAVASKIVRSLISDGKSARMTFGLSANNKDTMCEKFISTGRIAKRMSRDPGTEIDKNMPVASIKYDIKMTLPELVREKINVNGNESEIVLHSIDFFMI